MSQSSPRARPGGAPDAVDGFNAPGALGAPRRALITGGAGFIGSHIADLLLARGDHVTVIDDLSTGRRTNLPAAHERLRFFEADLGAGLAAFGPGERFDEVYHLAAAVGVRLVVDEPSRCIRTNIELTDRLLAFALTHGPAGGPAPTLIASSSEVYGKADKSPYKEDDDVVYGPTTRARWSYGMTKAIDEYLALDYHHSHRLPAVVARFFNTVGPRQVGAYGMVLPNLVGAALKGEDLPVFGDGRQVRCFCDVRDVAQALPRLLETPQCHGRVFNLGSDRALTVRELADTVVRVLGSRSRVTLIPYEAAYPSGFEDLRRRVPDLARVRAATGFSPRIPLEQTIHDLALEMSGGAWSPGTPGAPAPRAERAGVTP